VAREQARQRRARQARARALARLRPARDLAALLVVVLDAEIATPGGGGPALARFLAAP
jgi:hypothetical protein